MAKKIVLFVLGLAILICCQVYVTEYLLVNRPEARLYAGIGFGIGYWAYLRYMIDIYFKK